MKSSGCGTFMVLIALLGLSIAVVAVSAAPPKMSAHMDDGDMADENLSQPDSDYPNYDEDSSKSDTNDVAPIIEGAYLERKFYARQAIVGDSVQLECEVKNSGPSTMILWYNRTKMITQGTYITTSDRRISVDKNFTLHIKDVQAIDAGDFMCNVLPAQLNLTVRLDVAAAPVVRIFHDSRDVTLKSVHYHEGDRAVLRCVTETTVPAATITWAARGERLGKAQGVSVNDGVLTIERIEHHDAGLYQCLVHNNDMMSKLPHATVTVNVEYSPKVNAHRRLVNTGAGLDAQLLCNFRSEPMGRTAWHRNGKLLDNPVKYDYTFDQHNNINRTILTVKNVDRHDLGVYECEVINKRGKGFANVSLIYEPEPAVFEEYKINDETVYINWTVRSMQPLSDVTLFYQKHGEKTWSTEKPILTEKHEHHSGVWKIQHRLKMTAGEWHTRIRSQNTEGMSHFSKSQTINVPMFDSIDDGDTDELQSVDSSSISASAITYSSCVTVAGASLFAIALESMRRRQY